MQSPVSPYRVVLAANRTIPVNEIANHLIWELVQLPMDSVVLLRGPKKGIEARFEFATALACAELRIPVEWWRPDGIGREATYQRDVDMVKSAHRVVGYFDGDTPMEGGTGHVLERALAEEIPCNAWVWDRPEEALNWLGDNE